MKITEQEIMEKRTKMRQINETDSNGDKENRETQRKRKEKDREENMIKK